MIKLSDYVFTFIARQKVKHIFMLSGGGCMHLVDSVGKNTDLSYVCNLHEQACAIAAEAYGQYTNNLGVALVTTGPGGTNTITGVAGAWLDSTPCLFVSGQVKRADIKGSIAIRQMGFQEIDIVGLLKPVTKYAVTVDDPLSIRYHLEKAVYLARHGRPGPVWVDIPLDVQAAMLNESDLAGFDPLEQGEPRDRHVLEEAVRETIRLFNGSERPAILAGNGVRLAGALDNFLELIEILQVPVLTTWKAIDFLPESHALYTGRPGAIGQRGANFTQQNSDWLLVVGARLDLGQTAYSHHNFARAAKKIMVDIEPGEIGKMKMPIDVPLCADAGDFLREMLRQSRSIAAVNRSAWLSKAKSWQAKYPVVLPEYLEEPEGVNIYALIDLLSEEMTEGDVMVPGSSGACSEVTMQAFRVKEGMRVFNTEGLGSMGFGIPAALGGCLASGGRRTVCLEGDGGFIMNIQELETLRRLNLPVKFFVLNNHGYGSIRTTQRTYFKGHLVGCDASSGMTLPGITGVAKSFGIPTATIESYQELKQKVRDILESDGPVVCEIIVSPTQATAPRLSSSQKPDGSMVSRPMEDLFPFLSREELLSEMIIPTVEE
jgi:acetolactate synthase I/II/III large subunit